MYQFNPTSKIHLSNRRKSIFGVQPKLKIGQPGDKYEQEADSVADSVMRMNDGESLRMQPIEEEEEMMQMQPMEEEEELIQPKLLPEKQTDLAPETIHNEIISTKGNGTHLDKQTQRFMDNSFGADFSNINIHSDNPSAHLNKQLNARAFTVGNDIYFNNGEYNPDSNNGKHLLAHELTHTIQQNGQIDKKIQCDRRGDRETDREVERGRRRRDTPGGRDRGRSRGGDFDSDWAGRAILGRWLTGSGDWNIINNPSWSAYMMASRLLRGQLTRKLHEVVNAGVRTADAIHQDHFAVYETFSAVVENGEGIIGYQYLHGTNADVGGFRIWGEGRIVSLPGGQRMVILNLTYQWNDMIDPNPQYQTDSIKSIIGEIITLGQAESYEIHISWTGTASVLLDSSNSIMTSAGYPFY